MSRHGKPVPGVFTVTEDETAAFTRIVRALESGELALTTGTFRHQRAAFLTVVRPGKKKTDSVQRFPIAVLLREADVEHCRDSSLAPARATSKRVVARFEGD